jgi:hypothetical protein
VVHGIEIKVNMTVEIVEFNSTVTVKFRNFEI